MSCTPLPKAAKPVWAKQLTRLPCVVVCVKFQFMYTINASWKKYIIDTVAALEPILHNMLQLIYLTIEGEFFDTNLGLLLAKLPLYLL